MSTVNDFIKCIGIEPIKTGIHCCAFPFGKILIILQYINYVLTSNEQSKHNIILLIRSYDIIKYIKIYMDRLDNMKQFNIIYIDTNKDLKKITNNAFNNLIVINSSNFESIIINKHFIANINTETFILHECSRLLYHYEYKFLQYIKSLDIQIIGFGSVNNTMIKSEIYELEINEYVQSKYDYMIYMIESKYNKLNLLMFNRSFIGEHMNNLNDYDSFESLWYSAWDGIGVSYSRKKKSSLFFNGISVRGSKKRSKKGSKKRSIK